MANFTSSLVDTLPPPNFDGFNPGDGNNTCLIDVAEELAVIGTWPTRIVALISILVNCFLLFIFLHAAEERRRLRNRVIFVFLAVSDLLFSLYFAIVGIWTLVVSDPVN